MATPPHTTTGAATNRAIMSLAAPISLSHLLSFLMVVVDLVVVGQLGVTEQSGVGMGGLLTMPLGALIVGGGAQATRALVSNAVGAGRSARCGAILWHMVLVGAAGAVLMLPVVAVLRSVVQLFGGEPAVQTVSAEYAQIILLLLIVPIVFSLGEAFLQATGDSKRPFIAAAFCVALNIPLTLWLVHGAAGLPPLAHKGAAWASVLARVAATGLLLWWVLRREMRVRYGLQWPVRWSTPLVTQSISVGLPVGVAAALTHLSGFLFSGLAASMGRGPLATHTLANGLVAVLYAPTTGLSMAATIFAGHRLGAGNVRGVLVLTTRIIGLALGAALLIASVLLIFGRPVAMALAADAQVADGLAALLVWIGACLGLLAIRGGVFGTFVATQRTVAPAAIAVGTPFVVGLPLGWWLGVRLQLGLIGLWYALVLQNLISTALMTLLLVRRLSRMALADVG